MPEAVEIRLLSESDSLEELTQLLHAAYAELGRQGMNFTAVDQTVEITQRRVARGRTWLALEPGSGAMVGTITLYLEAEEGDPSHYLRPGCASFGQFGVHPDWRGRGIGRLLHRTAMEEAASEGFKELALDTASRAGHLISLYESWGYEIVDEHHWGGRTNYGSVIMALPLN